MPTCWPLNATFTYVASRLFTIELLEMLKGIGIDGPNEVFVSMPAVAAKFVKNGCLHPHTPYPFVSMVIEDDIAGRHLASQRFPRGFEKEAWE
ncbi:hypothetical protein H257_05644 [Aphanomyces astaci]|uniref:Uncharacterized protein n=1 Tax=Aphanomyces astaci TaxID=112090 RepID=W4GQ73_APHAT|nr:hypothetical protein H257_05644 [Aphanomyces astaci]ETV81023.1 hypothetical protein H257_05644 [Aphanomyces astaci]|eukprot:XP_009828881.1 hypothetical protein H257_05644 [Aphanomyces astaci]